MVALSPAHEAKAPLSIVELAEAWANIALDAPVCEPVPMTASYSFQLLGGFHNHNMWRRCVMPHEFTASRSRPARVAGQFYPGSAENLSRTVSRLLASAETKERSGISGIIVPHAGYVYSGPIAASAFASLPSSQSRFRRCVLVGPSHFVPFKGIAAPSFTSFSTPLGELPVDTVAVKGLLIEGHTVIDDAPHERDHAIEVELPFLQSNLW